MRDRDDFRDPRQFYSATFAIPRKRARMQKTTEKRFEFVEQNSLMATPPNLLARETGTMRLPCASGMSAALSKRHLSLGLCPT